VSLGINTRVYRRDANGNGVPDTQYCLWSALCNKPANGLRDAGPLGMVPICALRRQGVAQRALTAALT